MKKTMILALAAVLTACEPAPTAYQPEPFAFEAPQLTPITLNVHEIRVTEAYRSPLARPNVEQDFPVSLAAATKKWVATRLRANPSISANSILEITIEDASVKEAALPITQGVRGLFTDNQDTRYDARLAVTMRMYSGARGISDASGDIIITRSHTLNEKATIVDRQKLFHHMTQDMMVSLETEAQKRLRQYFTPYLR